MTSEDEPQGGRITGEGRRAITNSSRKNEKSRPKQKQCSVMNVSSKVRVKSVRVKINAIKNSIA